MPKSGMFRRVTLPVMAILSLAAAGCIVYAWATREHWIKVAEWRDAQGRWTDLALIGSQGQMGARVYTYLPVRPDEPGYAEWAASFDLKDVYRPRRLGGFEWCDGEAIAWGPGHIKSHGYLRAVLVPAWFVGLILAAFPSVWTALLARAWMRHGLRRATHGHCVHCGYDLRATPSRCPECGRSPESVAGATRLQTASPA
jgi:hypothetical protein